MNFVATLSPSVAPKSPAATCPPSIAAGDTYISLLLKFEELNEQLKIARIGLEHARKCATARDEAGVRIGLCCARVAADDIRKLTLAADEKIAGPDMDDASNVYGDGHA